MLNVLLGKKVLAEIIADPVGVFSKEEFMEKEQKDIQDTSCNSSDELKGEIFVLVEYFRKFMDVASDPDSKINPDYDFSLALLEGRIKKIRGMLKNLFDS